MLWLAAIAWAALIFYLSAQSSLIEDIGAWDMILRKGAHMLEFAVLSLLLWNAIRQTGMVFGKTIAIAAIASLLYAVSDEFHQRYVPGRNAALRDVGFDAAGIIIMSLIIISLRPKKTARARASVV